MPLGFKSEQKVNKHVIVCDSSHSLECAIWRTSGTCHTRCILSKLSLEVLLPYIGDCGPNIQERGKGHPLYTHRQKYTPTKIYPHIIWYKIICQTIPLLVCRNVTFDSICPVPSKSVSNFVLCDNFFYYPIKIIKPLPKCSYIIAINIKKFTEFSVKYFQLKMRNNKENRNLICKITLSFKLRLYQLSVSFTKIIITLMNPM